MKYIFFVCLMFISTPAWASPATAYQQALDAAAQGDTRTAIAMLQGAEQSVSPISPWHARIQAAMVLLNLQTKQQTKLVLHDNAYLQLANHYTKQNPLPHADNSTIIPAVLAAVFPGAGHIWLNRWHDAIITALLVWPMLGLTLWAWRRKMGPVTVFFAVITLWLWSGTVFSAMSLAERAIGEMYMLWWQGLWLSSGLSGHVPW